MAPDPNRTIGIPIGLALNFTINHQPIIVPMAIEEPSVVAAVSSAAKTISSVSCGFTATTTEKNAIIAQVLLLDIPDYRLPTVLKIVSLGLPHIPPVDFDFASLEEATCGRKE
ncbi:hypothetical protein HK102_014148 [Quaeritorhiza haematococci]|nr:hypothetical protein HK102_014148 [Quaeritorhiza haematococci]